MILPQYKPLYRMSLYAIVVSFLVQVVPLVAALTVKGETLPQVAAKISTICNAFSLIASLVSFWIDFVMTGRTRGHITVCERLGKACLVFFLMVGGHSPFILSWMYSSQIILSTNDASLRSLLFSVLWESLIPFVVAIIRLIVHTKEQLEEERFERFLLLRNRTAEA
jgi:hypothetical protein